MFKNAEHRTQHPIKYNLQNHNIKFHYIYVCASRNAHHIFFYVHTLCTNINCKFSISIELPNLYTFFNRHSAFNHQRDRLA